MRKDLEQLQLKSKLKRVRQPKNDIEAVIRHLTHQDVNLTNSQDALCSRLMYVDVEMRKRIMTPDEIVEAVKEKFNISQYRAQQDVYDCQKVFGETRKLSRNYLLSHHIADIALTIQMVKDVKDYKLLAKLYDNYTYAINSLPVTETDSKEPPPASITFVFNGAPPVDQKPVDDVLAEADHLLKPAVDGEYINYEEIDSSELPSDDEPDSPGE